MVHKATEREIKRYVLTREFWKPNDDRWEQIDRWRLHDDRHTVISKVKEEIYQLRKIFYKQPEANRDEELQVTSNIKQRMVHNHNFNILSILGNNKSRIQVKTAKWILSNS